MTVAPSPSENGPAAEKRVGLVLGAGGVLGVAWLLGGLSALAERTRWDPGSAEKIVGSSAGSIIGAYTAAGVPPWLVAARSNGEVFDGLEGMEDLPEEESEATKFRLHRGPPPFGPGSWRMVRRALKLPKGSAQRKGALILGLLPRGFVSTEPLEGAVRRVVPEGWVDHPGLRVTACDYATGALTAFGDPDAPQVDLATAVAASCAFPPFFHPVKIAGRRYIDGGIRSPSNLDLLAGEGLDLVICLNPLSFPERPGPPPRKWRARMGEALRANARRCVAREAEKVRASGTPVVVIEPTEEDRALMGDNMMSRRNRREVAELAARTVAKQIDAPDNWDLLADLPEGEPHKVARPAGQPSEWPVLLPARAGARSPATPAA